MLNPSNWNPNSDAYSFNEVSMMDWEGNVKSKEERELRVVLDDIPEEETLMSALRVCELEALATDATFSGSEERNAASGQHVPDPSDVIASMTDWISTALSGTMMCELMEQKVQLEEVVIQIN